MRPHGDAVGQNTILVKVGTQAASPLMMTSRRPQGYAFPAPSDVPKAGEVFYVIGPYGAPIALRCTEIKPDIGPLYYAEKA